MTEHGGTTSELFGWQRRDAVMLDTCDGCSEAVPCPYEWPDTEAWLCESCWEDATELDRARAEVERLQRENTELRQAVSDTRKESVLSHTHIRDQLEAVITGAVYDRGDDGSVPRLAANRCVHTLVLLGVLPEDEP